MVNHMRHTRGHTRNRRSHDALTSASIALCADCGAPKRKHTMCAVCGKYKGKTIIDMKAKVDRKVTKSKAAKK